MTKIFRFNDFLKLSETYQTNIQNVYVDTNFLISLTYDLSAFHEKSTELHELLLEKSCALFCNVNVRNEFLEVHRRILLTEALITFNLDHTFNELIPFNIRAKIRSLNTRREKSVKNNRQPNSLTEGEIKIFAEDLSSIQYEDSNLWEILCEKYLKNNLSRLWTSLEEDFNVNFLSLHDKQTQDSLIKNPLWSDVISIIETHGIASSDAMIINMFLCAKFLFLITSDKEVANTIDKINENNKFAIIPNGIKL